MPEVRVLRDADTPAPLLAQIHGLAVAAFAGDFPDEDWLHSQGGWRVIALDDGAPVSHAAVVPRILWVGQHELRSGYVEAVATLPARQRQGLGALVLASVNDVVRDHFQMGALSTGLPGFYRRLGWESWRGPTYVRDGSALTRTPQEDDGIMVLRFGSSESIDLDAPITCEARPGDAW